MILVTGASGKVGGALVRELGSRGVAFRIGARSPEKAGENAVLFDFDRPETFGPALDGIQRLFLLTSGGTEREIPAVAAAKRAGVARIVKLSVWGADEDMFELGRQHRAVEKELEASGIEWTFLRPNSFMQNFTTSFAPTIRAQSAYYPYGHDAPYSVIDARDVGAVAARALTEAGHGRKAYRLSGPESLTNARMAEKLSAAVGRTIRAVDLPDAAYVDALAGAGVPRPYAEALGDLSRSIAAGKFAEVTPDAERVLGRRPIDFDRFVREHAAVWK